MTCVTKPAQLSQKERRKHKKVHIWTGSCADLVHPPSPVLWCLYFTFLTIRTKPNMNKNGSQHQKSLFNKLFSTPPLNPPISFWFEITNFSPHTQLTKSRKPFFKSWICVRKVMHNRLNNPCVELFLCYELFKVTADFKHSKWIHNKCEDIVLCFRASISNTL